MKLSMPPNDPLKQELKLYHGQKNGWLERHLNEYVVIAGEQVAGFYPDYESAFRAAIREFGIKRQFLIKQICAAEPVYVVY
jgi:hypothetical protein